MIYNKKGKLNKLKTSLLLLMMVLFAGVAQAQVYMHNGEQYLSTNSSVKFYDSGGASKGPDNYWLHWYGAGQDYTFTFYPETAGNAIKVEFGDYTAYTDNGNYNHALQGKYTLRLNDTWLYVYEGNAVDDSKLITAFTGTVVEPFTMMANGPITFRFYSVGGHTEEGWDATVTAVAGTEYGLQKPVISKQVCTDDIVLNPTTFGAQVRYTTTGSNPTVSSTLYENPFQINYTSTGTTVKAICVNGSNLSDYAEKLFKDTDATPTPRALVPADIVRQENTIIITPPAVPDGINETYGIIYTTGTHGSTVADPVYYGYNDPNNSTYLAPDAWNGAMPGKIHFEWLTPNTDIKIAVVAQSCVKQSDTYTYYFEKLQIPTPDIVTEVVEETNYTGKATISFADGYTMRYTTDGSTPTAQLGQGPITDTPWTVSDLTPGTTVKVIVYKAGDDSYEPAYASKLYLPGEGQSGSYGSMVILNDLEPHSWSYYSDPTNPVRSLKPVDVKITYNGNGTGNMTSSSQTGDTPTAFAENASGVKVGVESTETQSSFMYLKTLERADGATSTSPTGRCEYTVIPNPFQVRPTGTGTGNLKYRGFYAWRLKSISGGSVYTAATGGTALAENAIVNADTKLYFVPSSTAGDDDMIEVEFEALWAQARVTTGSTNMTTYVAASVTSAYERNFHVVTSNNQTASNYQKSYPVTISSRYPDGSNGGGSLSAGNFTAASNTKFEYISLGNGTNNTYTANNHDLIFGRGVSGTVNYIRGINGNVNGALQYNLRLESGTFNYVSLIKGYWTSTSNTTDNGNSVSGLVTIKATIGSDYDRAADETQGANIVNSMIFGAQNTLSSSNNISRKTLDVIVKSGKIGSTHTMSNSHNADVYQSLYMSVSNSQTNVGERYLLIEGGEISNVAGGIDNSNQGQNNNGVRSLTVRMKGGTVRGAFYGGAAQSPASGDRFMVFTGGIVKSWLGAGCNGVSDDGGQTYGKSHLYVGGNTHVGGGTSVNGSEPGVVFGAGKGYAGGNGTSGEMTYGTNVVVADEAVIENDVYGGGNYGYALLNTNVYILGGTIQGNVFGGSNLKNGPVVNVNMKGGTVQGNIYGGSNNTGKITGLATINVSGGTVNNVFGGGYGGSTTTYPNGTDMSAGTVVNVTGGAINNNVYGGGEEGTVTGNTNVTISGGTMNDVYGAGKGSSSQDANISGKTYVTVTGGSMANVYGGGENGTVDEGGSSSASSVVYDFEDGQIPSGWANNGSSYPWVIWNSNPNTGSYCMASSNYNVSSSESYIEATVVFVEAGSVSFYSRISSESATYDYGRFYIDGNQQLNEGGTTNTWAQHSYNVTSGSHTFRWYYRKDGSINSGEDRYFIDDITFTGVEGGSINTSLASTVTISGGTVSTDVFGGGKLGTTNGNTIVNIKGNANVGQHVYGGALGEQGSVYVAGTHTVNVMGGYVHGNVYGGSRNANDALTFTPGDFVDDETGEIIDEDQTVCAVNISGGHIGQQVYAAGFFGNCFGSVYAFVGQNAIYNATDAVETSGSESAGEAYEVGNLYIEGSVWAGGDWGTFTDQFGAATISGKSNVYIDGLEYNTATTDKNNANYMCIDGSVYGSGTSCDAGNKQHTVVLRNYGEALSPYETATRNFASIQRADHLVLDNVHVVFQGQGRINSLNVTEVYAMYWITDDVIVTGGSTLLMNAPADQMKSFISASCSDVYTAALPTSETEFGGYTPITPSTLSATPNKIRVFGGNYIKVYYDEQIATGTAPNITYTPGYGMLKGYAYMMAAGNNVATCAYARPRWCTGAPFAFNSTDYDNREDGGWVSYISTDNTFALDGTNPGNPGVQMAYENHTPRNGEGYFRIWRTTGELHEREGVFDLVASGTDAFKYVDVEIELPAWRGADYYYKFNTSADGTSTDIDYGAEVMTFNSALYGTGSWLSYNTTDKAQQLSAITDQQNFIKQNPNLNYGLVIMDDEGTSLSSPAIGGTAAPGLIICETSDEFLVKKDGNTVVNTFTNSDNTVIPKVKFRLTFSDLLSTNKTYDPMYITLVQCNASGITDQVRIKLVVNTSTVVGRDFTENVYAVMNGQGGTAQEAHVQIVLPRFNLEVPGVESEFTVESIEWTPATLPDHGTVTLNGTTYPTSGSGDLSVVSSGGFSPTKFGMEFKASANYDGTTGWEELTPTVYDTKTVYAGQGGNPSTTPAEVGTTGGRTQFSFDFGLYYNGQVELTDVAEPELMGTIVYNMKFTNYGDEEPYEKTFKITLNVYRRGQGTRYYLDGVNGQNAYDGTRPDRAMLTLAAIFNRGGTDHKGLLPGDDVYVVNQVTVNDNLEWNGLTKGGNVNIYRYNGGHPLYDATTGIIGNTENAAYTWGPLVKVADGGHMVMRGITMDGYYRGTAKDEGTTVTSDAPLITIEDGGTIELNQKVTLQKNYNTTNGGAVLVNEGGTLMMNQNAAIKDNLTDGEGAGVYMNGTMIASDGVRVWDNMKDSEQNNVYLADKSSVLQIGVDNNDDNYKNLTYDAENPEATTNAKIGLSKSTTNFVAGVAEVVYSQETSWLTQPLNTQAIIVHDGNIYKLETGESANKLYWRDTWVTFVTSEPEDFAINNIDSEEDLAWVISLVNGENGQTADDFSGKTVIVKTDLNMEEHTWVPIGTTNTNFKGTFEGNGHVIEGLISSLNRTDLGMFGIADGATIQNVVAKASFDGVANNIGTIAGTLKSGVISNVEAAGELTGDDQYAKTIGGVVGDLQGGSVHSAFAVNTVKGQNAETVIGGLVGINAGNLFNSYANVTLDADNTASTLGGLVGENKEGAIVENCYVINPIGPAFAATNNGEINFCYAAKPAENATVTYVGTGTQPTTHGSYDVVLGRKALGYMYGDNAVTKVGEGTNDYIKDEVAYANGRISTWPGLLSTLNQWVEANPRSLDGLSTWMRPTTADINGDLPVLVFAKDNAMGSAGASDKFLRYSAFDLTAGESFDNGIDGLLTAFNKGGNIFLYGNATEVENVPGENTYVFVNEDAVLLQKQGAKAGEFINTTVGVTFDNSDKGAHSFDYYNNKLEYDWHMMSSSLKDANIGATYEGETGYGKPVDIKTLEGSYFPNGLITESNPAIGGDVKWDFYTYFEPEYHWINLKRSGANHWHTDGGAQIQYLSGQEGVAVNNNETIFVPGKGYMMAINKDSYMSNTGELNSGNVKIKLTQQESQAPAPEEAYNEGWNLVGNPYQAYLKMSALGDLGYAAYTYDADKGVYVPFVMTQSDNPEVLADNVHPHQAFFVHAAKDGDVLEFTPEMATTEKNDNSYFRDDKINYPLVNLYAENEGGSRDLTVIELHRPELGGVTKMQTMRSSNFIIAAHLDGQSYGLVFTPEGTERIPVHFIADENGTYTLRWNTQNGEFTSLRLVDNMTGTNYDMLANDHYTFTASTEDYASRFYITYTVTDVDENVDGESNFAYFDGTDWVINGQGTLDVVDVLGRTLFSQRLTNDQNRVNLNGVAKGVYLLRVSNGKNTMVQKIVVR